MTQVTRGRFSGATFTPNTAQTILSNLISWYDLEESTGTVAVDQHGNNDLTYTVDAASMTAAAGRVGRGMQSNTNSEIVYDNSPSRYSDFAFGNESFTWFTWHLRTTASNPAASAVAALISRYDTAANRSYELAVFGGSPDSLRFFISSDGGAATAVVGPEYSYTVLGWDLIACGYDAAAGEAFLISGGVKYTAAHAGGAFAASTARFSLGGRTNSATATKQASYDSAGVMRGVMTMEQYNLLYNNGAGLNYAQLQGLAANNPIVTARLAVANGSTVDLYSYKDPFGTMTFIESFDQAGTGYGVAWSPNGVYLANGKASSPYLSLFRRDGDVLTKVQDVTGPTSTVPTMAWTADSTKLYIGYGTVVARYNRSGDILTFDSSPGSALAGSFQQSTGMSLSPDGAYLACAHATSPYITVYRTSDWVKLANPSTLPTSTANGCAWHPSGAYLAVAHNTSPFVTLYSFSGEVLTKLADPSTLPAGSCNGVAWGGNGSFLVLTSGSIPRWHLYTHSAGVLTNVSTASFSLPGTGYGVAALGSRIVCGHTAGDKITLFTFNGTTIANGPTPSTVPSFSGLGVSLIET